MTEWKILTFIISGNTVPFRVSKELSEETVKFFIDFWDKVSKKLPVQTVYQLHEADGTTRGVIYTSSIWAIRVDDLVAQGESKQDIYFQKQIEMMDKMLKRMDDEDDGDKWKRGE